MAAVSLPATMPSEHQKGLHPFFERSTNQIVARQPQPPSDAKSQLSETVESTEAHHSKPLLEQQHPSLDVSRTPHSVHHVPPEPLSKKNEDTAVESITETELEGRDNERTPESKHNDHLNEGEQTRTDDLTNADDDTPRKRRKLSHSDSGNPTPEPSINPSDIAKSVPIHVTDDLTIPTVAERSNDPGKIDVQEPSSPRTSPTEDRVSATKGSNVEVASPPKKILQLNGAGGFRSPPSKTSGGYNPEATTDSTVIRPKKGRRNTKSLIIALRYGGDDLERRKMLGRKIDAIQNAPRIVKPAGLCDTSAVSASNPAKSTHPFFLGKSARTALQSTNASDPKNDSGHGTEQNKSSKSSPRKAFSSSGKIWMPQASNSTYESSHGGNQGISTRATVFRVPGTHDAPWPGAGFVRVEIPSTAESTSWISHPSQPPLIPIKRKTKIPVIEMQENILSAFQRNLSHDWKAFNTQDYDQKFHRPTRIVESGEAIQSMVLERLGLQPDQGGSLRHPSLNRLLKQVSSSLSAFDNGQCESIAWVQKYAPLCTGDVLQSQREMAVLKSWLQAQTVNSTNIGPGGDKKLEHKHQKQKRKKRKHRDEMDDFIVSSDEDENLGSLRDFSDEEPMSSAPSESAVRSLVREGVDANIQAKANAVLISGPHGCGKTAAALAAAKELDFDVFEIGPGSQRSGRDILDRIGDMTSNHQVSKARDSEEPSPSPAEDSIPDTPAADQKTLGSFFTAKTSKTKPVSGSKKSKTVPTTQSKAKQSARQKQAVILLEEVDVLFEQDKQFWETVVELAVKSKRPIIMTCTDENLVPQNELSLHAILRFKPPQEVLAAEYLLLLAAVEGHLLDFQATLNLYKSRGRDLRASLMELQYWCQMAIGDRKGGIEWFLPRWPPGVDVDEHHRKLRTTSNKTLPTEIILPEHASRVKSQRLTNEESLIYDAWAEWEVDPMQLATEHLDENILTGDQPASSEAHLLQIKKFEHISDMLSASDVLSAVDLPSNIQIHEKLDTTQPPITETHRSNYTVGYRLLQADVLTDHHKFDTEASIFTSLGVCRRVTHQDNTSDASHSRPSKKPRLSLHSHITTKILDNRPIDLSSAQRRKAANAKKMDAAFTPLLLSASYPLITSFERGYHVIGMDLAPYVRSIASFERGLERQREIMSSSQGSGQGKSKQVRTTRASRSALGGSQRSVTRRERWFPKDLDLDLVLATAGNGWPQSQLPRQFDEETSTPEAEQSRG